MTSTIRKPARNSPFVIDYDKVLQARRVLWTAKSLGIELRKETPFTEMDVKRVPKRASRKIKK